MLSRSTPSIARRAAAGAAAASRACTCGGGGAVDDVDVAVVGAGLVGTALARALAVQPLTRALRVAIIDRAPPPASPAAPAASAAAAAGSAGQPAAAAAAPGARVSALTPSSGAFLERLGAWGRAEHAPPAAPYTHMQVWDARGEGAVRFSAADAGLGALGAVVENGRLLAALHAALRDDAASGVALMEPAGVESLRLPPGGDVGGAVASELAEVALENGRSVRAKLVVGADGPRSRMRALANVGVARWPYGQQGVVATVRMEGAEQRQATEQTAWQRFLPTGPLALLPVAPAGYCNVVWSTTPDHATRLMAMDGVAFAEAVNEALAAPVAIARGALPRLLPRGEPPLPPPRASEAVGQRGAFPLAMLNARQYVDRRFALVGDAAHVVHPLAGQGCVLRVLQVAIMHSRIHARACNAAVALPTVPRSWRASH